MITVCTDPRHGKRDWLQRPEVISACAEPVIRCHLLSEQDYRGENALAATLYG
jgi:hypothetical protein